MPSTTFVLKEPNGTEPTLVYMLFWFSNIKLKYSTGQKINPKFWNSKKDKQRAKETRQFSGYAEFNSLLDKLENAANNQHRKLLNDGITPTPELIRPVLDRILKKENGQEKDLISFAKYIVESTDRKPWTKRQLNQAIRVLTEFRLESKRSLHFDSINLEFYDEFIDFLFRQNYGKNTIATFIKNVKVFMNEAVDRNLTTNLQYRNKRFKATEEPVETIYLSEVEVKKVYNLDLMKNPRLDKVRDLFIIACYTGLRFSDLIELRNENVSSDGKLVRVKTQKTSEVVIIPLNGYVKKILAKYDGIPPQTLSNQKMNEYLKELGELAEIEDDIIISCTKGGVRQSKSFKKSQLITTHTARRSFATNAYLAGVPTISIMKITSHRTEKSFLKYIKISQEDNANKLVNHPFFK
jgi:integrase